MSPSPQIAQRKQTEVRLIGPGGLLCAGQGEETHVAELESLGVNNFLTKPYDTETLLKTIKTAMATQLSL